MNADVAGGLVLVGLGLAWIAGTCIIQARDNARHRAVRRAMRAQLLDQLIEAADFDLWANELGHDLPIIDIEGDW